MLVTFKLPILVLCLYQLFITTRGDPVGKGHEEKHHALKILNDVGTGIGNHPSIPILIRKARDYASNYYYNTNRDSHTSGSYGAPAEPSYTASAYDAPAAPVAPVAKEDDDDDDEELLLIGVFIAMGLGAAGALGALVQHESIKDLETERNSICTSVQAVGNTALTATTINDLTGADNADTATNMEIIARLNLIENAINAFTTPTCTTS